MFLQVVRNQFVLFASMLYFSIAKATTMFIRGGVGIKKSNKKVEFFYKEPRSTFKIWLKNVVMQKVSLRYLTLCRIGMPIFRFNFSKS